MTPAQAKVYAALPAEEARTLAEVARAAFGSVDPRWRNIARQHLLALAAEGLVTRGQRNEYARTPGGTVQVRQRNPRAPREQARYVSITTDAITGKPATFRAKIVPDATKGYSSLVTVEHAGRVWHLTPKDWRDSLYDQGVALRMVGEPYESRRSYSAKRRAAAGSMAAWEKKALDDALLRVVAEYRARGATAVLLAEDLFDNHSWKFTRAVAPDGASLSSTADRVQYGTKKIQQSAVNASLARLLKAKKTAWSWGSGLRKGAEAKVWTTVSWGAGDGYGSTPTTALSTTR